MTLDHIVSRAPDPGRSDQRLSRRRFLQAGAAAGGGLMLSVRLPLGGGKAQAADDAFVPNAFIRIERDGQIVLTMPYVEMGQGTYTSIPMLIAEELEVELKQVRLEHAPPNEKLYANPLIGVQATGNSNAIRGAWQPLRLAGATARAMLVSAAAKRWDVDPASCRGQSGEVAMGTVVPFDLERCQAFLRSAHVVGDDGDGVIESHHLAHALDCLCSRIIQALHAPAENR